MLLTPVRVSDHALEQYQGRARCRLSRNRLAAVIRKHLLPQLARGMETDAGGAVHVRLPGDLKAVASPSLLGGWDISTVLAKDMIPAVRDSVEVEK